MDDDFWVIIGLLGLGILALMYSRPPAPTLPLPAPIPSISNEETWRWVDYRGRKRSITVKRDVKLNAS